MVRPLGSEEVVEHLPVALTLFHLDGRYLDVNAAAEALIGRPRGELMGQTNWQVFPDTEGEAWHRAFSRFAEVDALLERELALVGGARAQAHLWMERAVVRRDRLHDDAGARKAMHRALELVPGHADALAGLQRLMMNLVRAAG